LINHSFHYDDRKYSLTPRVVNNWNSLPNNVVDVHYVDVFKNVNTSFGPINRLNLIGEPAWLEPEIDQSMHLNKVDAFIWETLVRRGGITNRPLIACSLGNISAKNYQNWLICVEVTVCYLSVILLSETQCTFWHPCINTSSNRSPTYYSIFSTPMHRGSWGRYLDLWPSSWCYKGVFCHHHWNDLM